MVTMELTTMMMMMIIIIIIINNRINTGTNDINTMNRNNRITATLYSQRTQFVSGI